MKPLGATPITPDDESMKVIPANLHDASGEIFDDKLYSLYTLSTSKEDSTIKVSFIATDLVKHSAGDPALTKGYWVGLGIRVPEDALVYYGWGHPLSDSDLGEPKQPDGQQIYNDELYFTYYFNSDLAEKNDYQAYLVVDNKGTHTHYDLDFKMVEMVKEAKPLEPLLWDLVTIDDLRNKYMFGIDLSDAEGNPLPDELLIHYLNASVDYIATELDIVIPKTDFSERNDYFRGDYQNWGFMELNHKPVQEVKSLKLYYGNRPSVEIPLDWIQLDKLTGQITLFPQSGSANSLIIGQTGLLYGFQSQWSYAPMLWEIDYVAGIGENDKDMPLALLKEAIGKRATMGILNVWGDLIIGAGIASQSVSIDGISQSIGTTQSADDMMLVA